MDSLVLERLESALGELARTVTELKARAQDKSSREGKTAREYLSVKQLALLIPYQEQTIRNLICTGEFKEGVHYYKRRRMVIFKWSAVQLWLSERNEPDEGEAPFYPVYHARTRKTRESVL
jgi:hypothetical protein